MRLIDADALPVCTVYCLDEAGFGAKFDVVYKEDLDKARAIELVLLREPEPVREGVWIYAPSGEALGGTDATYDYKCSLCGEYSVEGTKYCPNCGKKMKSGFVWEKDFLEAPKEEA